MLILSMVRVRVRVRVLAGVRWHLCFGDESKRGFGGRRVFSSVQLLEVRTEKRELLKIKMEILICSKLKLFN